MKDNIKQLVMLVVFGAIVIYILILSIVIAGIENTDIEVIPEDNTIEQVE